MERIFDLLVVGGGINGAAIACDAAGRGLKVGICEMQDFAEGTSSRSSKLIHGGLRYLETYDFKLVRDALLEREILMRRSPHLVWPFRFVLPHIVGQRSRWKIRFGLLFYDYLARRKVLARSESVNLRRHLAGDALKPTFQNAFIYSDCRADDARLVIANLLGAKRHDAAIFARHRFVAAKRENGLWQVTLVRLFDGHQITVLCRVLVNATGPWAVDTAHRMNVRIERKLNLVRGSHIVVPRQWQGDHGYFLQTQDGRLIEAIPYEQDFTLIGTTDEPWEDAPEKVEIAEKEIDYLLAEVNLYLRRNLTRSDIVWCYSGVRPLFETGGNRDDNLSTLTRDYTFEVDHAEGQAPALTVLGGKLTTHRRLAEHAMQKLSAIIPCPMTGQSRDVVLPGGDFGMSGQNGYFNATRKRFPWLPDSQVNRYVGLYGTRLEELLLGAEKLEDLGDWFGADLYAREVEFLRETEWAETVDDIIWRRTKLGLRLTSIEIEKLATYLKKNRLPRPTRQTLGHSKPRI